MLFFLLMLRLPFISFFFFFNDTATTEIYTLSLHDALPICVVCGWSGLQSRFKQRVLRNFGIETLFPDRKSTRLNSSHGYISYAVFCLKKKKTNTTSCCCVPSTVSSSTLFAYRCPPSYAATG